MTFLEWFQLHSERFRAVLFDIDGTLATGAQQLPGAARTLEELRRRGFPYYFLTNDGNHSKLEKCRLVGRSGLTVHPEEIISCADALIELAEDRGWRGRKIFVLGDLGVPCYAEIAGMIPVRDAAELDACVGVVVGEGYYDWHWQIQRAMNFFRRHPERPLVVPNPDSYWPGLAGGGIGIGAGGVARFIDGILREMGIGIELVYLGKPYGGIYDHALTLLRHRFGMADLKPEELVMVGDSLASDVRGANRAGMTSALVLTGITTAEQAAGATGEFRPALVFPSL